VCDHVNYNNIRVHVHTHTTHQIYTTTYEVYTLLLPEDNIVEMPAADICKWSQKHNYIVIYILLTLIYTCSDELDIIISAIGANIFSELIVCYEKNRLE